MIICKEKRVCIFMVPKNASSTLYALFDKTPVFCREHMHLDFNRAWEQVNSEIPDFKGYRFYAVYRDPVDRFASAFAHAKTTQMVRMLQSFYGHYATKDLSFSKPLSEEWQQKLDAISVIDLLQNEGYLRGLISNSYNPVFMAQAHWLDHPIDMTYLNFHNFDKEIEPVLNMFGLVMDSIPRIRKSVSKPILTEEERKAITEYYTKDYTLFDRLGLKTWQQ